MTTPPLNPDELYQIFTIICHAKDEVAKLRFISAQEYQRISDLADRIKRLWDLEVYKARNNT